MSRGTAAPARTSRRTIRPSVDWARTGDHVAIFHLLRSPHVGHSQVGNAAGGISRDEFQAALDDPFYEPTNRLLIRDAERVAAHVQILKRTMWAQQGRWPIGRLEHLAVLPEYADRGFDRQLVAAAESQMAEDGAFLGVVRTTTPAVFLSQGWTSVRGGGVSRANVRRLLSSLQPIVAESSSEGTWFDADGSSAGESRLNIRLWKHFELAALQRLYRAPARLCVGAVERSEAYWHWLISRRAFDQIYVALDGPDLLELEERAAKIVGYAVLQGDEILELATAATHPTAATELLARIGFDALERDGDTLALHAPTDDPLHRLFAVAGGAFREETLSARAPHAPTTFVKILQPTRAITALADVLHARATAAELTRPCELRLQVDATHYTLVLSRRSVKVTTRKSGPPMVKLSPAALTRLLLGQFTDEDDWTLPRPPKLPRRTAQELLTTLFPNTPAWWTPWDVAPAR